MAPLMIVRALVRRTALLVTFVCLAWTLILTAFGGFDVTIFGLRIRSNNPLRVLFMASLALAVFLLAGGSIRRTSSVVASRGRAWLAVLERRQGWIALGLAIATTSVALTYSTRTAAGSDAYGYVSQAERWIDGQVTEPLPWAAQAPWPQKEWTFSPLGYRPGERSGEWTSVPIYSPGLPLLMAAAKGLGGQCALFALVPLFGGMAVLATYGLGRRLGSSVAGLIAAWFVATSPVVLGMVMEPLTDVPVMAVWALAFFFLLGDGVTSAFAAGLLAALAILIRPNLFALAGIMAAWFFVRRAEAGTRSRLIHAGSFALGVLPGIVAVAAINQYLYGSPATSGYGRLEDLFTWSRVWPNLRRYMSWYAETQTPLALLGMVALAVPLRRLWPSVPDRSVFAIIGLFVATLWAEYCAYFEFDEWGYLRFLLPSWPFLMLGLAAAPLALSRLDGRAMKWVAAVTIVGLGLWTFGVGVSRGAFRQWEVTRHDAALGRLVQAHTEPTSVVMAFERSGSLRYYAGRMTARYDLIDAGWLDRIVDWMSERGIHVYALLDDREVVVR